MTMSKKKEITVQINADLWEDLTKINNMYPSLENKDASLDELVSCIVDRAIDNFIDKIRYPNGNIHD
tara:strand:+ start:903 stop:1103 length:201 start_codon:yes stop_codon:yes gene_type:complete